MRRFCSYGPVDTDLHYYVPRRELVDSTLAQLVGDDPDKGGHYVTMWAPRQAGKTWVVRQVKQEILERYGERFAVLEFSLGVLREWRYVLSETHDAGEIPKRLGLRFQEVFPENPDVANWTEFRKLFSRERGLWDRPLILFIDEVDTTPPILLDTLVGQFREMYLARAHNWLHGLALIGVQAVLGFESNRGSPFNVQRSVRVPNLTFEEVESMYRWYERESGQAVEQAVIDRVFYETRGQPGLVSWLGELLTETYNHHPTQPLTMRNFDEVYSAAIDVLPNNNILNIVSKARQSPHKEFILKMFRTSEKIPFRYDNQNINFLYLNGVIDWEQNAADKRYVRFSSPFVQKRLFNNFSFDLFYDMDRLHAPFEDLSDTITKDNLNVKNLLRRYGAYLRENKEWLLKNVPRRADLRPYEAVYHFSLYAYLSKFLQRYKGQVWPEFPTGNGKVDLIIRHAGQIYGLEVKSFTNTYEYRESLGQAAKYGQQLGLDEITLAFFIETIDEDNRARYEAAREDEDTGVTVTVVFVATGT